MSVTREAMEAALRAVPLREDRYSNGITVSAMVRPDYPALADAALALVRGEVEHWKSEAIRLATLDVERVQHWQALQQRAEAAERDREENAADVMRLQGELADARAHLQAAEQALAGARASSEAYFRDARDAERDLRHAEAQLQALQRAAAEYGDVDCRASCLRYHGCPHDDYNPCDCECTCGAETLRDALGRPPQERP